MSWIAAVRLHIESDITKALPHAGPGLNAAGEVLARNPNLDRVVLEIGLEGKTEAEGVDRLLRASAWLTRELRSSGLFSDVGSGLDAAAFMRLQTEVLYHLPALFSEQDLREKVQPLLGPDAVRVSLERKVRDLAELGGVGQAEALERDPLDLRLLVLARLSGLMPESRVQVFRGQLLSEDGRHLLLLATPRQPGSDTSHGRQLMALVEDCARRINAAVPGSPTGAARLRLTTVGGFRSALDNETYAKADTNRAILLATVGIAILLICCFPRPVIGLLALLPATFGLAASMVVFSLFQPRISALALGFGGALVSITVDQGAAYLLFLDQRRRTSGHVAVRQLLSVGLFATLTTAGGFALLLLSGFPVLEEVGLLSALGVSFSFLFVHLAMPFILPGLVPARRMALLPMDRWLTACTRGRSWAGAIAAGLMLAALLPFARPVFQVDLAAMNTVTPETRAAEEAIRRTWGDIFDRVFVLVKGRDLDELRRRVDRATRFLEAEQRAGHLRSVFTPAFVLPGPERAAAQHAAWRRFFYEGRRHALAQALQRSAEAQGFSDDAFAPFLAMLDPAPPGPLPISAGLRGLLGITRSDDGTWTWFGSLGRGTAYEPAAFQTRATEAGVQVMDPTHYTRELAQHLSHTFLRMLALVAGGVTLLVVVLYLDLALVVLTLAPLLFAFFGTLGALNLVGHPLDIPGLMLVIVVFGMGIDYALFFTRAHQRYLAHDHPDQIPIRGAVFLASSSTLVGMVSLLGSEHAVPKSAGITASLCIGLAALGAFLILPPFLRRLFDDAKRPELDPRSGHAPETAVLGRLAHLSPYARLFARFKMRLDPMFPSLGERLDPACRRLLDVGCGLGVPSAWLLASRADLEVMGTEPDPDRARLAAWLWGRRGEVHALAAPKLPGQDGTFDAALVIDMIHYLDDAALVALLSDLRRKLRPGGQLLLRATVPGPRPRTLLRTLEVLRVRFSGQRACFRSAQTLEQALRNAGFEPPTIEPAAPNREETWFSSTTLPVSAATGDAK